MSQTDLRRIMCVCVMFFVSILSNWFWNRHRHWKLVSKLYRLLFSLFHTKHTGFWTWSIVKIVDLFFSFFIFCHAVKCRDLCLCPEERIRYVLVQTLCELKHKIHAQPTHIKTVRLHKNHARLSVEHIISHVNKGGIIYVLINRTVFR